MAKKLKILLIEDDPNLGTVLHEHLKMNDYEVVLCTNGEEALKVWKQEKFDLCLADIMMPKMDGFSFVENVRKEDKDTPIIFLTAKSLKEDKIKGFRLGCDDYITKPFSVEELLLRINAVTKRSFKSGSTEQTVFKIGTFDFDYNRQQLLRKKKKTKLTPKESDLLLLLCQNMNQTVKRETALIQVWDDDSIFAGRSMDVFISKLRKYLKDDPKVELLGLHGKGFRLVDDSVQD